MTVGIAYVDGPRLARSLFAAADWVAAGRDEINRINVFPVPDGDTGTNFSLTLRAVADALRALGDASLPDTARTMARAAVLGARGNSGMMLAHFLLGFAESLGDRRARHARDVAAALRQGADRLYESLDDPREGTILTVARDAAAAAERAAAEHRRRRRVHAPAARGGRSRAGPHPGADGRSSRKPGWWTPAARASSGCSRAWSATSRAIRSSPVAANGAGRTAVGPGGAGRGRGRARLPVLHRGAGPRRAAARRPTRSARRMHAFGGSVRGGGDRRHPQDPCAHRHPGGRLYLCGALGPGRDHQGRRHAGAAPAAGPPGAPAGRGRHRQLGRSRRQRARPAPHRAGPAAGGLRRRDLPRSGRAQAGGVLPPAPRRRADLPTTSQPAPAEFVRVLRDARAEADEVVGVLLSGSLSGTFDVGAGGGASGRDLAASTWWTAAPPRSGVGMLALRGAELAEAGWTGAEIARELERVRGQSGMLLTVDRYDNLLRSGRVSRGKAWIGRHAGREADPVPGRRPGGWFRSTGCADGSRCVARVLALLEQRLTPRPTVVRFGVAHADAPEVAERVRTALVAAYRPRDCFVTPRHRRARHPRGPRRLGDLLSGRGRHPRPARRTAAAKDRTTCGRSGR